MTQPPAAVTYKALAPIDIGIIGAYFVIIFGIGVYFARKGRTSVDYFLAGRNVGWFAIGASLFVSNISTEHFIGLAGSGATSGLAVGHFEWLACLILLILGLGVRAVLPALERVHDARVPGAALQSRQQRVPREHLDPRVHLHEDLRAPVCGGDRAGARGRVGSDDGRGRARDRDRRLHDHRRPVRRDLHRAHADARAARGRGGPHVHRPVGGRRFRGPARGRARSTTSA